VDDATEFSELLAGLRAGDPAAAGTLYGRYGPFIRAAVRRQLHPRLRARFDSLDFVQDVWVSFLAVPADRYTFDSPQALLGFLNRVAYNKVVEVFRRRFWTDREAITREEAADGANEVRGRILCPAGTPSQWAIAGEEWERLLSRFPAGHRAIVERLREGHSNQEVARMANVSLSTVNRVVRRLKELTGL
jgi:RNA polymerase sigma-70 factor (ECF subfamily)